jgi:hypothetical protein
VASAIELLAVHRGLAATQADLQRQVGEQADAHHRQERHHRQRQAEHRLRDQHGRRLASELRPAQPHQPIDVDRGAIGDGATPGQERHR